MSWILAGILWYIAFLCQHFVTFKIWKFKHNKRETTKRKSKQLPTFQMIFHVQYVFVLWFIPSVTIIRLNVKCREKRGDCSRGKLLSLGLDAKKIIIFLVLCARLLPTFCQPCSSTSTCLLKVRWTYFFHLSRFLFDHDNDIRPHTSSALIHEVFLCLW